MKGDGPKGGQIPLYARMGEWPRVQADQTLCLIARMYRYAIVVYIYIYVYVYTCIRERESRQWDIWVWDPTAYDY